MGLGWSVAVFGIWLVISPFVLGFSHFAAGTANDIIVGIVLVLVTFASTRNGLLKSLLVLLGGWIYISGFTFDAPGHAFLFNNLVLALLIIVASVTSETPFPPNYRGLRK